MNLEKQLDQAQKRIAIQIEIDANKAHGQIGRRIESFEKAFTWGINVINFKAVSAEKVGWDGFVYLESSGNAQFAEIL